MYNFRSNILKLTESTYVNSITTKILNFLWLRVPVFYSNLVHLAGTVTYRHEKRPYCWGVCISRVLYEEKILHLTCVSMRTHYAQTHAHTRTVNNASQAEHESTYTTYSQGFLSHQTFSHQIKHISGQIKFLHTINGEVLEFAKDNNVQTIFQSSS